MKTRLKYCAAPRLAGPTYPNIEPLTIREAFQKLLAKPKSNKASRPDAIPAHILKDLATELYSSTHDIFHSVT